MFRRDTFLTSTGRPRPAFTLVELMVVIAIISITTVMAVAVVTTTGNHDRVRSSASLVQSALMGGRDRAIRAKAQQGVRFFVDTNNPNTINGFAYIGVPDDYTEGTVTVDNSGSATVLVGSGTRWVTLFNSYLTTGAAAPFVEVPKDSGNWFLINVNVTADDTHLTLTQLHKTKLGPPLGPNQPYRLRLPPALLPNQEIQRLSSGIVIDTERSRVGNPNDPAATITSQISNNKFDVLFSPNGTVWGPLSAKGRVFFWLSDVQDKGNNSDPAAQGAGEMFLVALFTQTGHAGTYPIDVTDTSPQDNIADDAYRFAKTGGVAGR